MRKGVLVGLIIIVSIIVLPQCEKESEDPFYFDSTKSFVAILGILPAQADSSITVGLRYGGGIGQELNYFGVCWRSGSGTITLDSPGVENSRKPIAKFGTDFDNDGIPDFPGFYYLNYERFVDVTIYYDIDTVYTIRPFLIMNETITVYGSEQTVDTS